MQELNNINKNPEKVHLFKPETAYRTNIGSGWRSGGISFENDISFYLPNDIPIKDFEMYIKYYKI